MKLLNFPTREDIKYQRSNECRKWDENGVVIENETVDFGQMGWELMLTYMKTEKFFWAKIECRKSFLITASDKR